MLATGFVGHRHYLYRGGPSNGSQHPILGIYFHRQRPTAISTSSNRTAWSVAVDGGGYLPQCASAVCTGLMPIQALDRTQLGTTPSAYDNRQQTDQAFTDIAISLKCFPQPV
jgi:hypothetical protein